VGGWQWTVGSQISIDLIDSIDLIACPLKRDPVYRDILRGIDTIE